MSPSEDPPVALRLRNERFDIPRSHLMELPESVLLCLFPNGLILNNAPTALDSPEGSQSDLDGGMSEGNGVESEYYVDFDAACLSYILQFFDRARREFYGTPEHPRRPYHDLSSEFVAHLVNAPTMPNTVAGQQLLFHKQAAICLREELEYFAIPPKRPSGLSLDDPSHPAVDDEGFPNDALQNLKKVAGEALLQRRSIFAALQRNVNREKNMAEQQLIDMLCMSGFDKEDEWGYRALEPSRCVVTSIALCLLNTGIDFTPVLANGTHQDSESSPSPAPHPTVNNQQLSVAAKLLLFWRKPARKCWWDASELLPDEIVVVDSTDKTTGSAPLKVWARRIWTLETVLI